MKVEYVEHRVENVGPGAENEPSPIVHNRYLVSAEGGVITATDADGGAITDEELAAIRDEEDDLGRPPVMEQIMARTWRRGERVELTAAELARLAEGKPDQPHATAMSFTFTGVDGAEATFAMTMKMEDDAHALAIDVTGTAVVEARTGRPHRLELAGPLTGTTHDMPVTGTMKSVVSYEFHD